MKIIDVKMIHRFARQHADARPALVRWVDDVTLAVWERPEDIKASYATASFLSDNRVIFNIKGNRYRLYIHVQYRMGYVTVLNIGTHEEYETWSL